MKKKIINIMGLTAMIAVAGLLFINASKKYERQAIISLLENERDTYNANDFTSYSENWVKDEEAMFLASGMENYYLLQGWNEIEKGFKSHMDWKEENNIKTYEYAKDFTYHFIKIDGDLAWVNMSQYNEDKSEKDRRAYVLKRSDKEWKILNLNMVSLSSYGEGKFVVDANKAPAKTHVHLNDFPKDKVFPMIEGWGGMCVDINNAPAGTEFSPLLEGLKNDHCQVPHWGYVVKGAIRMDYEDGTSEVFRAGEAFYMKPGHTGGVQEDLLLVSFGPEDGIKHLVNHFETKIAQMNKE